MTHSGELSLSRSRKPSTHNNPSSAIHNIKNKQAIIAVEPDYDFSEHRRIDQGLLDASMEARNPVLVPPPTTATVNNKSWWGGFTTTPTLPPINNTPDVAPSKRGISHSAHVKSVSSTSSNKPSSHQQHRRIVSLNKTYRIP